MPCRAAAWGERGEVRRSGGWRGRREDLAVTGLGGELLETRPGCAG